VTSRSWPSMPWLLPRVRGPKTPAVTARAARLAARAGALALVQAPNVGLSPSGRAGSTFDLACPPPRPPGHAGARTGAASAASDATPLDDAVGCRAARRTSVFPRQEGVGPTFDRGLHRRQRAGEANVGCGRARSRRRSPAPELHGGRGGAAGAIDLQDVDAARHVEAVDDLVAGVAGRVVAAQKSPG
jgi:hypothetical protein